jgi:hypothetical protein
MRITETLAFYLLVGVAVSAAMYWAEGNRSTRRVLFLLGSSWLFWPLYLPILLSPRAKESEQKTSPPPNVDEMATAINQVERELKAALSSLEGWPEAALAREKERVVELRAALGCQAVRIREMDALLAETTPANDFDKTACPTRSLDAAAAERWQKSQQAREQNFTRLATIRRQSHADLMATLAWIRELVSMIHLAKFTGAPVSRTEELVAQIEAAVEGVSLVEWCEHESDESRPSVCDREPQTVTS